MRTHFLILLIIFFSQHVFGQQIPDSLIRKFNAVDNQIKTNNGAFDDYFQRAVILKSAGDFKKALNDYDMALTLANNSDQSTMVLINRGSIYQEQKQFDKALSDFNEAVKLSPKSSFAYNNRGYLNQITERIEEAISDFEKSIELDQANHQAYVNLVAVYKKQKNYKKAEEVCDLLIKNNQDVRSYIHKADYFQSIGKLSLALLEWNKAVIYSNENPDILIERSTFKDDVLNDDLGAVEDCKMAISKNPNNASYYYKLSRPLYDLEEYDEVSLYCDKALKLNPNYFEALIMRGNVLDLSGKINAAKKDYLKAIEIKPSDFEGYYQLSILFINNNQLDSAITIINDFIKIDPTNYKMLLQQAKLSVANNEMTKALEQSASITKTFSDLPDAFFLLGYLQDSIGKKNEACENMHLAYKKGAQQAVPFLVENCPILLDKNFVQQYNLSKKAFEYEQQRAFQQSLDVCTELIKIAPDSSIYYYNRGKEYRYLNQHENAIKDYKKAIQLDSTVIEYWVSMAVSYSYLDQSDMAVAVYKRAVNIDPTYAMIYYNLGNIYASKNDFSTAIPYLQTAIEYKYDYGNAYLSLGECYGELQQNDKACESFIKAERFGISQAFAKRVRYCREK